LRAHRDDHLLNGKAHRQADPYGRGPRCAEDSGQDQASDQGYRRCRRSVVQFLEY
jgi:hypothetical protein